MKDREGKTIAEILVKLHGELFLKCVVSLVATLSFAIFPTGPVFAQTLTPGVVSARGYINSTPLTAHTTAAFDSGGATTLVAFVSGNPSWNGLPVSISGLSDNVGNTWNVLTGPSEWAGGSFTLLSAIYYVNAPVTTASHTLTVNLTNPAPLVVHVFAVSGSDITRPPVYSAITDPGVGGASADVMTAPITVPDDSLLLSWVKNETSATATALDGYTLDAQSTSFLWAESQTVLNGGSYTGHFQYDTAIGWQTAIVGLKPQAEPVAFSRGVTTDKDTPLGIILTATSPQGFPLTYSVLTQPTHGALSDIVPNLTYTPGAGYIGPDAFTFKANDGTADSNVATVRITVQGPVVVSSRGYLNTQPLTAHTTAPVNSSGATTLVAFVSSHPLWDGLPVSISGLSDNVGNTWSQLTGPTTWVGNSSTLFSAIYYVNAPSTSATHMLTVNLTNPASLVVHVFAVSGSDITGPPISSAITDPGVGATSADVKAAPIALPANSLLLSWVKNETDASASAVDGYTLDTESTSFLWAESQTALTAGSYPGHFQYETAIGWQTAIVGLKPHGAVNHAPVASDGSVTTNQGVPVSGLLVATGVDANALTFAVVANGTKGTAAVMNAVTGAYTYTPNPGATGSDTFTFKANDGMVDSNVATITVTITPDTTPPPAPALTSTPADPTNQTSASFSFADTEAGVSFLCQLDRSALSACPSPMFYAGRLIQGSHKFSVKAQDAAGNQSGATSFTWTIDTKAPAKPVITSRPATPTNQTNASVIFADTEGNVSFLCQLDQSAFVACTSPVNYPGPLAQASHRFSVKAQDAAGNQSGAASFSWTVDTKAPPKPVITSTPPNPTNQTTASLTFSDAQKSATFLCQLDSNQYSACLSPQSYSGLSLGGHTFSVKAQDAAGNQSVAKSFTWTIM